MISNEERLKCYLNDLNFINFQQEQEYKSRYIFQVRKKMSKNKYKKLYAKLQEISCPELQAYLEDYKRIIRHSEANKAFEFYFLDNGKEECINSNKPIFVKCRHKNDNKNIIVNLNKRRHWGLVEKINEIRSSAWNKKKKELVWRGIDSGEEPVNNDRLKFIKKYHKKHNVGFSQYVQNATHLKIKNDYQSIFLKDRLTLTQITSFKYILILEGNDKSSSLNWVLNSNCVPLMKKPTWHSWLCEPFLRPNYHYIELKDDFSDIEEKLQWLRENDDEAKEIAYNGIKYIETNFLDLKRESHLEKEIIRTIEPHLLY
jgi:hypothetical protein